MSLNALTAARCQFSIEQLDRFSIKSRTLDCGTKILDFGIETSSSLSAGTLLAEICLANLATVSFAPAQSDLFSYPTVFVHSDNPLLACMGGQYAGWPVQVDKYFAMGSGPMRMLRGKEKVLQDYELTETSSVAVGVLETDSMPGDNVCSAIAAECDVQPSQLWLCVAPTRSIAGCVQVVARSVETCLHKLFELGFDLHCIKSATGYAPLCPPATDFAKGIGRTNDAILYGGNVCLWVDADDAAIESIGPNIPSRSSADWGRPFVDIFKSYNNDFYQVDSGLFSPAVVTIMSLKSGKSWQFGELRPDLIRQSFETHFVTN